MIRTALWLAPRFGEQSSATTRNTPVGDVFQVDDFHTDHGRLVMGVMHKTFPRLSVIPVQANRDPGGGYRIGEALKQLVNQVKAHVASGKAVAAINLSMGTAMPLGDLATRLGLPIPRTLEADQREGLKSQLVSRMKQWIQAHPQRPFSTDPTEAESGEDIVAGIDALSTLAGEMRIPTFVAGGVGPDTVNLYTLAPGVRAVNVLHADGRSWVHNPRNPFITDTAVGEHDLASGRLDPAPSFATPHALATTLASRSESLGQPARA